MSLRLVTCTLFFALFSALAPPAEAISDYEMIEPEYLNLSLGAGLEYETGDYGTVETTDIWRIPFIVQWAPLDHFSLSLEIPYLQQSRAEETTVSGGGGIGSGIKHTSNTVRGLGDITLDASLTFFKKKNHTPRLLTLFYAKLPTADEQKGLGTGEFDWGIGLGLGQKIGQWSVYTEALSIQPGTSATYDPDSYWEWLVSLSYRTSSSLRPGVSISGGSAPFDGADGPLEIKGRLSGIGGEHTSYSLYLSRGLSDASPDWCVGVFGYLDY